MLINKEYKYITHNIRMASLVVVLTGTLAPEG
jgi:hypothetical protein